MKESFGTQGSPQAASQDAGRHGQRTSAREELYGDLLAEVRFRRRTVVMRPPDIR